MEDKNTTYYMLLEKTVARSEGFDRLFLFKNGKWIRDEGYVVMDHLMGYDPSEPEDSPYCFGSTSILMEMEEITEEEAVSAINQQIAELLIELWKKKFKKKKEGWDKAPLWPAKLVETTFRLNGIEYTITPEDIGLGKYPFEEGFMESIQKDLERDLELYGATDIHSFGFLD